MTVRKRVADEVRMVLENGIKNNHRSFIMILGTNVAERVPTICEMLKILRESTPPKILWCYKDSLQVSSHKGARSKKFKEMKEKGLLDEEVANQLDRFLNENKPRYCKYKDTASILGNTYGVLILQDFKDITPNILARTVETVSGGGTILMLLEKMSEIEQVKNMTMSYHEGLESSERRFNRRFVHSLPKIGNFIAIDSEFNVLRKIVDKPIIEHFDSSDAELKRVKERVADTEFVGPIVDKVMTIDQAQTVLHVINVISKFELNKVVGITASRGRGKSAALGLALAFAVAKGYSNIFVTSPAPSNVATLFAFILKGFDALKFNEEIDYEVISNNQKEIIRINVHKTHRQTICYIPPQDYDKLGQCEILAIDEAAAIPLPIVKKLMGPYTVLLSSTVNGYEGTGRALSLKLLSEFRRNRDDRFSEIEMSAPIRYAANDPIEKWLTQLLCLNAEPAKPDSLPAPDKCTLAGINRNMLFGGSPLCETILNSLVGLSVASHYKNEPDDLILMSDAPNHRLFALLPPLDNQEKAIKNIICYVQVAIEGKIGEMEGDDATNRGKRPDGNLIPWTLRRKFCDREITMKTGLRIVRIAVHPDMQGKGYGSAAIKQLISFYNTPCDPEAKDVDKGPVFAWLNNNLKHEDINWFGVSFGLTQSLFNFWRKLGFRPVYIAQPTNSATGEHSAIVLRSATDEDNAWIDHYCNEWRMRFGRLLGFEFRDFPPMLCDSVYNSIAMPDAVRKQVRCADDFFEEDVKRLRLYSKQQIEFSVIEDLVPRMCAFYFEKMPKITGLSRVMETVLLVIGFQHHGVTECADRLGLGVNQVYAAIQQVSKLFADYLEGSGEIVQPARVKESMHE